MSGRRTQSFSLLELIVVMVLLTVMMAIVAPRLTGFFHGQRLDGEARRLWALTRYARDEAILQALPMRVWLTPDEHRYGVETVPGYGYTATSRSYDLDLDVMVAAEPKPTTDTGTLTLTYWPDGSLADGSFATLVLQARSNPADAWRLTRDTALATFSLTREAPP